MQEGKAEWVTSLLFFHFVRISTPQTPKTRLADGRKHPMPTASEGRRACGRGPPGGFGGSFPCPPGGWRTRPSAGDASPVCGRSRGRAGEPERRAGRRRREVPPGPRGCGRTPASPHVALAHPAGRPCRDPLSREAPFGALRLPAPRGPFVAPSPSPGALWSPGA